MRTGRTGLSFKKGRTSLTTENIIIRYLTFSRIRTEVFKTVCYIYKYHNNDADKYKCVY